jgi:nicotinamide riboside kinase
MKIGFCGTMSVGKTTLVNALKDLPEFKEYECRTERSKHLMSLGIPLNTDSTLKGQTIFLSERSAELMQDNIITDRTVLDVMAFAQCSESMNYFEKHNFVTLAACLIHEYDYIFYVSPEGVDIEDNGIRETDAKYRKTIDETIKYFINKHNSRIKSFIRLKGSTEERIRIIQETLSLQYV